MVRHENDTVKTRLCNAQGNLVNHPLLKPLSNTRGSLMLSKLDFVSNFHSHVTFHDVIVSTAVFRFVKKRKEKRGKIRRKLEEKELKAF